jgi:hypothetical protein
MYRDLKKPQYILTNILLWILICKYITAAFFTRKQEVIYEALEMSIHCKLGIYSLNIT